MSRRHIKDTRLSILDALDKLAGIQENGFPRDGHPFQLKTVGLQIVEPVQRSLDAVSGSLPCAYDPVLFLIPVFI